MNRATLNSHRHEKEHMYGMLTLVVGGLVWLAVLLLTAGTALLFLIPIGIMLFIVSRLVRASLFGNSVQINSQQFPEIYDIIKQCSADMGLDYVPTAFVINSGGSTNALATRIVNDNYLILYSKIVDLMNSSGNREKLKGIIGHEIAHHAAGHVHFWKNLIRKPAYLIPFLGAAYSRSCEFTSDRLSAMWVDNKVQYQEALVVLACGSDNLAKSVNVETFTKQETEVPDFFGFLQEILSSHPRMTKRIIELDRYPLI